MTDAAIYRRIKKYFCIQEFVDERTYKTWGEDAWQFVCPRLLHTILIIREGIGLPMTINNWKWGGRFDERGLRANTNSILHAKTIAMKLYLSGHVMLRAADFDVKNMTAEKVRNWILKNSKLFPYKIRLEHKKKDRKSKSPTFGQMIPITWVHLDVFWLARNPNIYLFNV